MKKKRILKILLATLATLLLLLVLVVLFWLGPTVKLIVQQVGSKALGSPLTIGELSINPRKGTMHLSDFAIANPQSFGQSNAVSLANLDVAIDMGSVFTKTVVVHRVQLNSPHFIYEQSSASDNITEFVQNIAEFAGIKPDTPAEPEENEAKNDKKASKVVVVQSLEINDIQFHLANTDDPYLDFDAGLEQIAVSMTNGIVNLKNLHVSNPERLASTDLFTLDGIDVRLDPTSIYSDKVSILDVRVRKPHAHLELNPETSTVAEFMKIAEGFVSKLPANTPPESVEPMESEAPAPPTAELHSLVVEDIQLRLLDTTQTNAPAEPRMLAGIGTVSIKLGEGLLRIDSITIPNPAGGFVSTNLFHLAGIEVEIDPESLFSEQVVISQVLVDSPEINLEQTETTGNVAEFQKLAAGFAPPPQTAAAPQEEPSPTVTAKPVPLGEMPVVLERLTVTNLAVNMVFPPETNLLENAFPMPSIGSLNPLASLSGVDTNATEEVAVDDGFLTLLAFDHLSLEPLKGLIQLDNLQVGNPKGFANKNIVKLDGFQLDLDPDTLQADVMLIREILIDNPTIAYERKLATDNIKSLQNFIADATTPPGEDGEKEPAAEEIETEEPTKADSGQKVIIEHLLVKSGLVKAKLSALPSAPIPLPKIEMNDIGKEKGGASFIEAVTEIGQKFYDAIIGTVSSVTGFAGDALKGIGTLTLPGAEEDDAEEQEVQPETTVAEEPAEEPVEEPQPEQKKRRSKRRRIFPR